MEGITQETPASSISSQTHDCITPAQLHRRTHKENSWFRSSTASCTKQKNQSSAPEQHENKNQKDGTNLVTDRKETPVTMILSAIHHVETVERM